MSGQCYTHFIEIFTHIRKILYNQMTALQKTYENTDLRFCPYTGENGSVKICILAYFMQS